MPPSRLLLLGFAFGLVACGSGNPVEEEPATVDGGEYDLTINNLSTGAMTHLIATAVDTSWQPELGLIYMSTDDGVVDHPIGTVTMEIADLFADTSYWDPDKNGVAELRKLVISKTDVRVGTAAQLNAQVFELTGLGEIDEVVVGKNFIRGRLQQVDVHLLVLNSTQSPESARVTGTFTAVVR